MNLENKTGGGDNFTLGKLSPVSISQGSNVDHFAQSDKFNENLYTIHESQDQDTADNMCHI